MVRLTLQQAEAIADYAQFLVADWWASEQFIEVPEEYGTLEPVYDFLIEPYHLMQWKVGRFPYVRGFSDQDIVVAIVRSEVTRTDGTVAHSTPVTVRLLLDTGVVYVEQS
jgi:hypothetical protein